MATPLNGTVTDVANGLGPLGSLLGTIFTMVGGIVGVYIIYLFLAYLERKRFGRKIDSMAAEISMIRKSMQRIEKALSRRAK